MFSDVRPWWYVGIFQSV